VGDCFFVCPSNQISKKSESDDDNPKNVKNHAMPVTWDRVMSDKDELDADSVRAIFEERPALEERLTHFLSHRDFSSDYDVSCGTAGTDKIMEHS